MILGVVLASAAMSAGVLADAPTDSEYSDILNNTTGDGSSSNPHVVTTLDELQAVQGDLSSHYVLGNNIDASETETWNSGAGFTPIVNDTDPFSGSFDGQGYSVDGLYINRPNTDYVGLFGKVSSSDIKNIGVTNLDMQGGDTFVGGLVGLSEGGARITNSYSSGNLSGEMSVGGLVGVDINGTITKSYSHSNVSGHRAGGLVGSTENGTIEKSYSTGEVSGNQSVGGIIGAIEEAGTVVDSYSLSSVTGDDYIGGLVGANFDGTVVDSYSLGVVSGDTFVGGLVGYNSDASTVVDSYWNIETSTQSTSDGSATGLTIPEMTGSAAETNMNLEFTSVWSTVLASDADSSANLYPILESVDRQSQLDSAEVYEPPTRYTVDIIVEDSEGTEISGATVDIDGTDGANQDLPNGTYTITASAESYDTLNKDLTVDGEDKTVTFTLSESTYSVDVLVEDSEGNAISGATVEIDGQTLTTNSTVQPILTLTEGTYNYTISKAGNYTISDMVIVNSDTTINSVLNQYEYDINVTVLDELQEGLSNAKVTFQGQEYQTYPDGNLTLVGTSNESYNITVYKDKYVSSTQSITIEDSPTTLSYTLDYKLGEIEGNVTDDSGNPIENTSVTLDTLKTTKTDSTGFYRFDNLLVGEYALGFESDGYNSIAQSVTVQNDTVTTNDVTLQYNSTTEGDEDWTTSDGAIGVEIVVDEYRIVENQEANLKAELSGATGDEVSFEWFVSGESFGGDKQSIDYFFDDDGDYRVSVRVTEDATGDIVEGNLSLDEEDWTEDGETGDREIIYTDLTVKTYDSFGNPINALVFVNTNEKRPTNISKWHVNHTTEWQVAADNALIIHAEDSYFDVDSYRPLTSRYHNVTVAAGETKTVELELGDYARRSSWDGNRSVGPGGGDGGEDAEDNPNYPEDNGVGGVLFGDGGGDGDGNGGISAAITLSILVAAGLVIIIGVFWLFKLLAAVLGIDGGTNGLGRILRGKDD